MAIEFVFAVILLMFLAFAIFLAKSLGNRPRHTPPIQHLCTPVVTLPRRVTRPGVTTVAPRVHHLWQLRGWRREGHKLRGAYRTPRGACSGEIVLNWRGRAQEYFILNPPSALLSSSHGPCFRPRGLGRYWIHFSSHTGDVDSGIEAVERLLDKALKA